MRLGNRLAAGKQPVGVLPTTQEKRFCGFCKCCDQTIKNQTTNQQNKSLTIKD